MILIVSLDILIDATILQSAPIDVLPVDRSGPGFLFFSKAIGV